MAKQSRKKLQAQLDEARKTVIIEQMHHDFASMCASALQRGARAGGDPTVLIIRSGGFGDNLQAAFVAKSVRECFPEAYIALLIRYCGGFSMMIEEHAKRTGTRPVVNNWIETLKTINHQSIADMMKGGFDVVIDTRYVPKAHFADHAIRRNDALLRWKNEADRQWFSDAYLQRLHYEHPLSMGDFARLRKNLLRFQFERLALPYCDKLDMVTPDISEWLKVLKLKPREYVTLAAGAGGGAVRKEYPMNREPVGAGKEGGWNAVLKHVQRKGLTVVQVGKPTEEPMPPSFGVDMRGKVDFPQVLSFVAGARFHVGVEGGLVHFARCFDTPSLVCHGPTGRSVFGYSDNVNKGAEVCLKCFWHCVDWHTKPCPKGYAHCENFPSVDELCEGVDELVHRTSGAPTQKDGDAEWSARWEGATSVDEATAEPEEATERRLAAQLDRLRGRQRKEQKDDVRDDTLEAVRTA